MEISEKAKKGTLKVSENVIISITKNAAMELSGVQGIAVKHFDLMKMFSSKIDNSEISVTMMDGVAKIAMSIVVKSGYNIVFVCEQIQERVKAAVQSMTGVTVSKVNVSVADVDFSDGQSE